MVDNIFARKRSYILGKWLELIVDSHPAGSKLMTNKDQFTNPVGYTITSEIEVIFDELLEDRIDSDRMIASLDSIIRTRAVQDFTPGDAVSFLFLLKTAIRNELKSEKQDLHRFPEIEERIDQLVGQAVNVYTNCREEINRIRINEIKKDRDNAFRLLERTARKHKNLEAGLASSYNGSEVMQ